jgi:hypothetical protein
MTSRQYARPGRKHLRRARLLRDPRRTHAWRNAFVSLVAMAGAIYAVTASFSH